MTTNLWAWGGFLLFIFAMLAIDLGLFHKVEHEVSTREASIWTVVWVTLALLFNAGLWRLRGPEPALQFLTGYLIEYSLSVDNIFVFIMLFSYFQVPMKHRHRVLFWGILGALVMRATLIGVGTALINRFHWVIYIFGAFLVYSAFKMAMSGEGGEEPENNAVVRLFRRTFPVTERYHKEKFFIKQDHRWLATPLFIVLLVVETTDVMFALDSIPAIFAITTDAFIVFTSNVFAILGLRSLYFLLDGIMGLFRYLKIGLSVVLGFIGIKMLTSSLLEIPIVVSLGVVAGILVISVLLSVLIPEKRKTEE